MVKSRNQEAPYYAVLCIFLLFLMSLFQVLEFLFAQFQYSRWEHWIYYSVWVTVCAEWWKGSETHYCGFTTH